MSLSAGATLGPYEIVGRIGAGGMGEVYRARDTRLGRDVAIKVAAENFTERFAREARAIAALNHPNICHLYDVGPNYLVMELIEGTPLRGPLPPDQALDYARQIADALQDAHERGIVHRDLKPGNILLTPGGVVKIVDFGLAKNAEALCSNPETSPTMTISPTGAGMILGTAAYMAPEQARGKAVDKRADIWAFGCVLYEMLTGERPFAGETTTDILAAVVTKEPHLVRVPANARRLVETCLKKDPKQRLQAIGDWSLLVENPQASPTKTRSTWLWIVTAAAVVMAAVGWFFVWRGPRPVDHPITRLSVDLGPDAMAGLSTTVAISPDGRRIVYPARGPAGQQRLATRLLDQAEATLLPGTDDGFDAFFSPDGQWIGFYTRSQVKKISVEGGSPVTLSSIPSVGSGGASWSGDGGVIATLGVTLPLWRIPAAGGTPQAFTRLAHGETTHRWPQVLPDGSAVLFTAAAVPNRWENANIEAFSVKTGQVKILQHGGYYGRYLPSGHFLYVHQGVLYGVKFDLGKLEVQGKPVPILEDLAANPITGGGQFDFSNSGTLVYATGKTGAQRWRMDWLDGSGRMQPISALGAYAQPCLSPDGREVAYVGNGDLYVQDLERGVTSRLTFSSEVNLPAWAPDGKHLLFESGDGLFWVRRDGAADPQLVLKSSTMRPWSIAPDGRQLASFDMDPETGFDIWTLPLDLTGSDHPKAGKPEVFLRTSANEMVPRFSPDGRWIAYRSDESGSYEIYVRPFPAGRGGKWQISAGGGQYAFWSKDSRELFYETVDNRIMVVDYAVNGDSFNPGKPRLWSDKQLFYTGTANLDLAPDGKRFLVFDIPEEAKSSPRIVFLLNIFDELKRKIQ